MATKKWLELLGPCIYRLFLFRFAFDNTQPTDIEINHFPFSILSKQTQNRNISFSVVHIALKHEMRKTILFFVSFIIARYENWNTVDDTVYRIPFHRTKKRTELYISNWFMILQGGLPLVRQSDPPLVRQSDLPLVRQSDIP